MNWLSRSKILPNSFHHIRGVYTLDRYSLTTIGLATKWSRILSLGGIDKIRNHLVANPVQYSSRLIIERYV